MPAFSQGNHTLTVNPVDDEPPGELILSEFKPTCNEAAGSPGPATTMKVSVLMITYNQQTTIAQAIESAVVQETAFDCEIVISEDCSRDGTRGIVERFAAQYPDKIRLLLNDRNLGVLPNFIQAYRACRGEYIAILEGDDYWTAAHKLQKQVDFLYRHPECAVCFHDALVKYEGQMEEHLYCPAGQKEISDFVDMLLENFIPTCSVMIRNRLIDRFPDWLFELKMADWPVLLLHAHQGKIGYINEPMAVYYKNPAGIWRKLTDEERLQNVVAMYQHINRHFKYQYDQLIRVLIGRWKIFAGVESVALQYQRIAHDLERRVAELEVERATLRDECESWRQAAAELENRLMELGQSLQSLVSLSDQSMRDVHRELSCKRPAAD